MLFLCKICEKMNQDVNIGLGHGAENCTECFPGVKFVENLPISEKPKLGRNPFAVIDVNIPRPEYKTLCAVHHILGRGPEGQCSACNLANVDNVDLNNCSKEQ